MRPWAMLCAAYPRMELNKATVTLYHERLRRFDVESILYGVNLAIDNCKFFPTIAELIENMKHTQNGYSLLDEPRPSDEEAKRVLQMIREAIGKSEDEYSEKIEARKELLRKQAAMLNAKEKEV